MTQDSNYGKTTEFWSIFESRLPCATSGTKQRINEYLEKKVTMTETKQITKAIIEVMKKVEGIDKSMTVGTGSNSYKGVSDKDVRLKIGLAMRECGLCIVPTSISPNIRVDRWEEESEWNGKTQTKQKQSIFTEVETKYLLLHESGESIELSGYGHGVDTQDKGAGKATTYALKNTLLATFLVPTGVEDTDNTHSDDLPIPKQSKPAGLTMPCKVHNVPMTERMGKNGPYFAHQVEGGLCFGKPVQRQYKETIQ